MSQEKPLPGSDILTIGTLAPVIAYMNFKVQLSNTERKHEPIVNQAEAEKTSLIFQR